MLAGGGVLRHRGVSRAFPAKKPRIHGLAMLKAPRGKKLFWGGSTLGLIGLPPLAAGTTHAVRGDVDKALDRVGRSGSTATRTPSTLSALAAGPGNEIRRPLAVRKSDDDQRPGFWREGLRGTRQALGQKVDNARQPVPAKIRGVQLGIGAATGALGSVAARAALGRRGAALKPVLTPVAGGLAATASVPASNHYVSRKYNGYEVTPYGVRRKKKSIVRPSSKSSNYTTQPRNFSQDVNKAASTGRKRYQGADTPYMKQRAVITAAGHPPVIGPFTQAAAAARYAPPGQGRKEGARQWAMASGAGIPIGVAGAYGGAHLARHSKTAEGVANDVMRAKHAVHTAARRAVGLKEKGPKAPGKLATKLLTSRAGKPFHTKAGAAGGAAGFLGAKMASGTVLGQTAITMNQNDQRRYNKVHHIEKLAPSTGQTKREKHSLATQKRRSAALSEIAGTAGLTSLGLLAARKREPAILVGTIGSGVGGVNALLGSRVQRKEAAVVDPVKKALGDPATVMARHAGEAYQKARVFRELGSDRYVRPHPDSSGGDSYHVASVYFRRLGRDLTQSRRRMVKKADYSAFWAGHRAARKLPIRKPRIVHLRKENGRYACGAKHVPSMSIGYRDPIVGGLRNGRPIVVPGGPTMRRNAEPTSSSKYVHNVTCESCKASATPQQIEQARAAEQRAREGVGRANSERARQKRTGQHPAAQAIQSKINKGFRDKPRLREVKSFLNKEYLRDPERKNWNKKLKHGRPGFLFEPRDLYASSSKSANKLGYFGKADALAIKGNKREHADYLRRYGDRGPLPKNLSREDRMKAYEARYVHHGGQKQNAWAHRTKVAESVKNVGVGVGTVGGAAWLATRGKRGIARLAKHPNLARHGETTAVVGATLAGAGEMAAGIAHRRQASYANSPGGVAASALRRMRAYTPEEQG